ncbi:MAG: tRNA-dihydrouridine synthase family protein [bacterium]|nr:tRNA-dihydrouridine synthase family protein [bacterium]
MKFYFAPLVNVTGYVYRNAHYALFPGVDKYFAPFVSPAKEGIVKQKELIDLLPENNKGMPLVPQVLTNESENFIATAKQMKAFGYDEINLNLGCPSAPVVARGRGSGFLARKDELDQFLEEVFAAVDMKISIKARLGKDNPEEIYGLMELFNKYPLDELIIHARIQQDFYKNTPNREMFKEAARLSKNPICYNGDIYTKEDYESFHAQCPSVERVMMGRGLLHNPGLVHQICTGEQATKESLFRLHDRIFTDYGQVLTGDSFVLSKMKQFWFYVHPIFKNSDEIWSLVKDCEDLSSYKKIAERIFCME